MLYQENVQDNKKVSVSDEDIKNVKNDEIIQDNGKATYESWVFFFAMTVMIAVSGKILWLIGTFYIYRGYLE